MKAFGGVKNESGGESFARMVSLQSSKSLEVIERLITVSTDTLGWSTRVILS